jgi:addiction module RelB/DinJ family antitoxin
MKSATISAEIDADLKRESERILADIGLSTDDAIRVFLSEVIQRRGLPFSITAPTDAEDIDDILLPARMREAALDVIGED